ncbi:MULTISPECIES: SDR family NAD(P)-dependent oxidoreductase [Pseudofrankia]|uniref:SDR family NAD(P)-dependent oxidoreductase n=1 Tax=Pseudofrankia TaxID=2994363 RepID=UPI000480BEA8|nr:MULTISPECIES: SDR family NAD(P)-dependent oxidoreductase [Pseudofrankia]OHV31932.1 3-hydroxy-2-methylbutyryl-CoA dehydrogenase [Pseudofrankia sp. EUN1h]
MELVGKAAVVAGGAGGLGGATVRRLAALGVGVVVLDPDADRAAALGAELGPTVMAVTGDSNDDEAVAAAISAAQALGVFSIAVSATGVVIPSPRLVASDGSVMSTEVLRANLDLHVCGPFNLTRLAASAFSANAPDEDGQRGVVVQTASISAFDAQATMVPYAAAKGAIVAMLLPMARDLAAIGVRVCAIAPGAFATPRLSNPVVQELLVRDVLFPKRLGRPEEYALLAEAIIRNPYLNGEVIRLDGAARLSAEMTPSQPPKR